MSERKNELLAELRNKEYRETYGEQHVNAMLAAQINAIREQRGLTQAALAELIGKQQPAVSRIENVNYARWSVQTLREVAAALGCWLDIRLKSWGSLVKDATTYSIETLRQDQLEDDPVFFGSEAEGPVPEPVRWVQKALLPWLESAEGNGKLSLWLGGKELPPLGDSEPPFVWIGRAIEVEPPHSKFRGLLIERVLALLSEIESGSTAVPGENPLPVGLFNLLAMFPSEAGAKKLMELYSEELSRMAVLPDQVRTAFLSALIRNQTDRELEDTWLSIIREGSHSWLPANELDGFEGLKWMAPRPRVDAIANGLQAMYYAIFHRKLGVSFVSLMEDLKCTFSDLMPLLGESLWREGKAVGWESQIVDAYVEVFASNRNDREQLLRGAEKGERKERAATIDSSLPKSEAEEDTEAHLDYVYK